MGGLILALNSTLTTLRFQESASSGSSDLSLTPRASRLPDNRMWHALLKRRVSAPLQRTSSSCTWRRYAATTSGCWHWRQKNWRHDGHVFILRSAEIGR